MITRDHILAALQQPLPGETAHNEVMSYARPSVSTARQGQPVAKESAVMMLLMERPNGWHTLLIERPKYQGAHSGQLAFPGGRLEDNETHLEAALRETFEEIGLAEQDIEVIGRLSELYIPPSHFVVAPFVALTTLNFFGPINSDEVVRTIEVPLAHFSDTNCLGSHTVPFKDLPNGLTVPGFLIEGQVLWGATAMMIQEFRHMIGFTTK